MLLQTYISNRIYDDNEIRTNNDDDNVGITNCYDDNVIEIPVPKVFDALSRRLFSDELVLHTVQKWGMDPRLLWRYAKNHGIDALITWIRDVYDMHQARRVDHPGRYLVRCLKSI